MCYGDIHESTSLGTSAVLFSKSKREGKTRRNTYSWSYGNTKLETPVPVRSLKKRLRQKKKKKKKNIAGLGALLKKVFSSATLSHIVDLL